MRKAILAVIVLAVLGVIIGGIGLTTVGPGYVAIRVDYYGTNRGVETAPIQTGTVFYNRYTQNVYTFPTYLQNAVWAESIHEGAAQDEAVSFNSREGVPVICDVALNYRIVAGKVPVIFAELRQDADHITHYYMRNKVRDAFSRNASKFKAIELVGEHKIDFLNGVLNDLRAQLGPKGFDFDSISIIGKLNVPASVQESINLTITASQRAIEAENKVKQSEAEARQRVAKADGERQATIMEAEGHAKANQTLTSSLSPALLNYEALQRWNGVLPTVVGGNGALPFINVNGGGK